MGFFSSLFGNNNNNQEEQGNVTIRFSSFLKVNIDVQEEITFRQFISKYDVLKQLGFSDDRRVLSLKGDDKNVYYLDDLVVTGQG